MKKLTQLLALMCVVTLVGFALGCDGGGSSSGGGCDGGSSSSSSSSSGGGAVELDRTHAGWQNPNCWACHSQDSHNAGLDPADCVECHGDNGAQDGHTSRDCSNCHANPSDHPSSSFPSGSCTTCH